MKLHILIGIYMAGYVSGEYVREGQMSEETMVQCDVLLGMAGPNTYTAGILCDNTHRYRIARLQRHQEQHMSLVSTFL